MPLRLGFDLDGVLADMNSALLREARRLFPDAQLRPTGAPAAPAPNPDARDNDDLADAPSTSLALTPRQERQLWEAVKKIENFWETLDETEDGIVARLAEVARARRWEVMFLTSRPRTAGDIVQIQSQRWLVKRGFEYPSLFVVHGSRGKIAASLDLDVVVDDRPENCLDVALDSKARAILIWRGAEGEVPASARRLGIGGVPTVAACLDLLVQADDPDAGSTSLVDRLRRLLRLKPQPAEQARA